MNKISNMVKKTSFIICAVMVIFISACSKSGSISSAFEMVQKDASYEKVFEEILPIIESDDLDDLSMEEKCELSICVTYISTNALKALGSSMGSESMDNKVLEYFSKHSVEIQKLEAIALETMTSSEGQSIYENMTGTARNIVEEWNY